MRTALPERIGGLSLILGAPAVRHLLVALSDVVADRRWPIRFCGAGAPSRLAASAITALAGIVLMLVGFYFVYARIRGKSGWLGALGFLFIEAAYFLQGCKVTWEIFLYPVIAAHPESGFLLADGIIRNDPAVVLFRAVASLTILAGIVLFSLAVYRSRDYPPTAPALVFIGALTYATGPFLSLYLAIAGIFIFAVGCLMLGIEFDTRTSPHDSLTPLFRFTPFTPFIPFSISAHSAPIETGATMNDALSQRLKMQLQGHPRICGIVIVAARPGCTGGVRTAPTSTRSQARISSYCGLASSRCRSCAQP